MIDSTLAAGHSMMLTAKHTHQHSTNVKQNSGAHTTPEGEPCIHGAGETPQASVAATSDNRPVAKSM